MIWEKNIEEKFLEIIKTYPETRKVLAFKVMERFLKVWFSLKEDIIKVQHNCKATWFWVKKSKDYNFLLIMHEHLFIFKKLK